MHEEQSIEPSLKSLFIRTLKIEDMCERRQYLDEVGAENPSLKNELERLLAAQSLEDAGPVERAERWLAPFRLSIQMEDDNCEEPVCKTPRVIGRYQLLETLGEGGMGTVYLARQTHPVRREVALKLIKPGMDSREVLARFETEMRTLGMMEHDNIAGVLDAGLTAEGRPYFVMELVLGDAIDKHCANVSATLRQRLELFISLCRAIQHAHNRGTIHRDLKPANVLVKMQDGVPKIKVIDFGIAKALSCEPTEKTQLTRFKQLVGTPLYMSPEQVREDVTQIDYRSDVYSLGVLLYELVAGSPPVDRELLRTASVDTIRHIICEGQPASPSRKVKRLSEANASHFAQERIDRELDWIVLHALEKEPERRYASASDLADDLQRYLNGELVQAGPPSMAYRLRVKLRKYRGNLAVGIAFLSVLLLAAAALYGLYRNVLSERQLSDVRHKEASDLRQANLFQATIRALADHDLAAMRDLLGAQTAMPTALSRHAPQHASFFRLLGAIAQPEPVASVVHPMPVRGIAGSPATQEVFGVDEAGKVFMYDMALRSPIRSLGAHWQRVDSVAVSPDGTQLVSGALYGQVWLWDLKTKRVIRQLASLNSGVETLIWSPDGKAIAAGGRYSEFVVYNAAGDELLRQANDHRHESLLFSPDSQQLIVPTRKQLEVWDIGAGKLARILNTDRTTNVRTMCWAGPNRQWLIVGDRFSEALVAIDFASGKPVGSVNVGAQYARTLSASPNGNSIAAAYSNGHVQLIHVSANQSDIVAGGVELKLAAHAYTTEENASIEVQWIDRHRFLTAGADGAIKLWDVDQLRPYTIIQPPPDLLGVNWSKERSIVRYVRGDSYSDSPKSESTSTAPKKATGDRGRPTHNGDLEPHVYDYAAAHHFMAAAGAHRIGILDAVTQQVLVSFESPMAVHHFITLSKDATHLAATSDSQISVWRTKDGWETQQLVRTWPFETTLQPLFSNHCKSLFVDNMEFDNLLELDIATGRELQRFAGCEQGNCALNGSGTLLATATTNGLKVWDLRDHSVIFEATDVSQPMAFHFFDDEQVLVSGHLSGEVRAWHLATRQPLGSLFSPHEHGRLVDFQLSPDGTGLLLRYRHAAHIHLVILGHFDLERP